MSDFSAGDEVPPICMLYDITRVITELKDNTSVTWNERGVSDNCGEPVILVSRSHSPGDTFSLGTTQVTYIFSDETGNTATCAFNVMVFQGSLFVLLISHLVPRYTNLTPCVFT